MAETKAEETFGNPYPGLRYYQADQADFFAGRDDEAKSCTKLLGRSRVLVLHGRSGCGKSSFLRAGVKPRLEEADRGSTFPENFEVVRSSQGPLGAFTKMLLEVCDKLVDHKNNGFWKPEEDVTEKELAEFKKSYSSKKRRKEIASSAIELHKVLVHLVELLEPSPVFVIDQAEEVFTLFEKEERALAKKDPNSAEAEQKRSELEGLRLLSDEFFEFLGMVAEKGPSGVRLVVSLRTEYKGQLDDRISRTDSDVSQIKGYYLEDLTQEGLIEAIKRPTHKSAAWKDLREAGEVSVDDAPYNTWGFSFNEGVAEDLARSLSNSDQVPEGGVLPTLQIACVRLFEQARQAKKETRTTFEINRPQLRRIGAIDSQVQEYVSQRLQEACREAGPWKTTGEAETVEHWHAILFKHLVEVQADGRAVTDTIARDELIQRAADVFTEEKGIRSVKAVIEYLRREDVALLNYSETDGTLTLGHDSVALSLNKWNVKYNLDDRMTVRMMMGEAGEVSRYVQDELFPRSLAPHQAEIIIHNDNQWDRQYPHFAQYKKFSERLGITFAGDRENLDITKKKGRNRAKDWASLAENLRNAEKVAHDARMGRKGMDKVNQRVLVAADWHSFPRTGREDTDLKGDDLENLHVREAQAWSDILVTDLFVGNALIGPEVAVTNPLEEARSAKTGDPGERFEKVIRESIKTLVERKGIVRCHDDLSVEFLGGAAELTFGKNSEEYSYVSNCKHVDVFVSDDDQSQYPLADWFLDWNLDDSGPPRYIVGTAATRAIALQGGGQLFFGTSELTRLARTKIEGVRKSKKKDHDTEKKDLHKAIQSVIKHTTWQLGLAPAQWNQGRNKALVLRLASIGYYTVEYIRSNSDEFVLFVQNLVNARLSSEDGGTGNSRGVRMGRDSIRSALRDCYSILRFDEYGTEFYDLDSTTAYATNHSALESKSVAGEVYNELASLRQRTIVHYEAVSRMIIWLRDRGGYSLGENYVDEVTELKDCAWRNFRIFNFYDSFRFMSQAALILQREMDAFGKYTEE